MLKNLNYKCGWKFEFICLRTMGICGGTHCKASVAIV